LLYIYSLFFLSSLRQHWMYQMIKLLKNNVNLSVAQDNFLKVQVCPCNFIDGHWKAKHTENWNFLSLNVKRIFVSVGMRGILGIQDTFHALFLGCCYSFIWESERELMEGQRGRERDKQTLSWAPHVGVNLTILRSWAEPKSGVSCSTGWATRRPALFFFF